MRAFENCDCPLCRDARRRMTRWDWLYVALCLAGAVACVWGMR